MCDASVRSHSGAPDRKQLVDYTRPAPGVLGTPMWSAASIRLATAFWDTYRYSPDRSSESGLRGASSARLCISASWVWAVIC